MKRILFLSTGGTIACKESSEGLIPALTSEELLPYLGDMGKDLAITCEDLLKLDSSNIQPEEWQMIARRIYQAAKEYDGIVMSHGTDTMAYTASALSFMLPGLPIPLLITGAQLPLTHVLSDGINNIRVAFTAACSELKGVYVAFNRKIMLGSRCVKVRTMGFDAFESVNAQPVGIVDARGLHLDLNAAIHSTQPFTLHERLCKNVMLIKLIPGMNPEIFDILLNHQYQGVVIEAFGAGGINFIRRDLIAKLEQLVNHGISVVVCSQCLYENSDFTIYETGQKALQHGVIQGYDMTSEACVTKLMTALGQTNDLDEVRRMFATSYVNEITLPN